ncbi:mitochondrial import receptor subunit TOM5 homolog [Tenrec ecaudatus]|uniref:mitochondrial import receptor subunit TOM5 homolog n=1 Tax=Tenrec ecaudatus TaxID=94439 RepID=UPI003F595F24
MFRIEGLVPNLDPEEMKRKMRKDVISTRNFPISVALLRVTPWILQKWDSAWKCGIA